MREVNDEMARSPDRYAAEAVAIAVQAMLDGNRPLAVAAYTVAASRYCDLASTHPNEHVALAAKTAGESCLKRAIDLEITTSLDDIARARLPWLSVDLVA